MQYSELYATSNFSFLRGASHPEEYIETAADLHYRALAITDINTLAGVVRAYSAAKEAGINYIVASRVLLYRGNEMLPYSLLLYPESLRGYGNLSTLLSRGKLREEKGCCRVVCEDLVELCGDLIAIIDIHQYSHPSLKNTLEHVISCFPKDKLSFALYRHFTAGELERIACISHLAKFYGISLVATGNVLYHDISRHALCDILTCIRKRLTVKSAGYLLQENRARGLRSLAQITRAFNEFPQAVKRTQVLTECVSSFSLEEVSYKYPRETYPQNSTPTEYLREITLRGAQLRYPNGVPKSVYDQITHELKVIESLSYEHYFLTVYDIVCFARSRGILCQGRGAAANSAVCYMLGITAVDPSNIRLLFERFISPERHEPPDIDIDFEHERREEVLQYVYNKYGRDRAALTSTVVTFRSRSALREVAQAFGLAADAVVKLCKKYRYRRLDESITSNDPFFTHPRVQQILTLSKQLKGFPRHLSQHVGGFVISDTPLHSLVPVENARMQGRTVIEWDKDDLSRMGMMKIDLLSLGMLTCIRKALAMIPGQPYQFHTIPAEDTAVYDMICQADTLGVFQIESRAQMNMLPRLRPRSFYDLVIEVAIVRPGPIQGGLVHPYLRRRRGEESISYPDDRIKDILSTTLGVPIFQEQIMELCVLAAGFTPGEADRLRRTLSSWARNKKLAQRFGARIIEGMKAQGYSVEFAELCLQQIHGFSAYGFPQSHAASFALVVYVSAWIKCHHPAIFAAALLNSQPLGFYQPAQIIRDARQHGVQVRPIDALASSWDCSLEYEHGVPALRLGMRLVKGLERAQALRLESLEYKGSCLRSLWRSSGVSLTSLRALARADAFGCFNLTRQRALWEIARLKESDVPLFESFIENEQEVLLPEVTPAVLVAQDYQSTSLSLKAHPVSFLRPRLSASGVVPCVRLTDYNNGNYLRVAGLVLMRQKPLTASGVMFITLEDEHSIANLVVKPHVIEKFREEVYESTLLVVKGQVQREGQVLHLIVSNACDITSWYKQVPKQSRDFR